MKKFVLLLFFLIASLQIVANENLKEANLLYSQEKYEEAYNKYKEIEPKTSNIYYNLGNCAYKLNKLGLALLYWKKAQKDWGLLNRKELNENILLVQQKLGLVKKDQKDEKKGPLAGLLVVWQSLKNFLINSIDATPLLHLQFLFLFFFLMLLFSYKYFGRNFFYTLFFCCLVSLFFILAKYLINNQNKFFITSREAFVYSGPGKTFQKRATVYEGMSGVIEKEADEFSKISIDGMLGWIEKGSMEEMEKI
jgi:hypothetical protein